MSLECCVDLSEPLRPPFGSRSCLLREFSTLNHRTHHAQPAVAKCSLDSHRMGDAGCVRLMGVCGGSGVALSLSSLAVSSSSPFPVPNAYVLNAEYDLTGP